MYIAIINWKNVKLNIIISKTKLTGFLGLFLWSVSVQSNPHQFFQIAFMETEHSYKIRLN